MFLRQYLPGFGVFCWQARGRISSSDYGSVCVDDTSRRAAGAAKLVERVFQGFAKERWSRKTFSNLQTPTSSTLCPKPAPSIFPRLRSEAGAWLAVQTTLRHGNGEIPVDLGVSRGMVSQGGSRSSANSSLKLYCFGYHGRFTNKKCHEEIRAPFCLNSFGRKKLWRLGTILKL